MDGRQHSRGATFGAAFAGGALCGALAWLGYLIPSALAAAALVVWIARRVARAAPPGARERPGPLGWSPYDRRRSGRARHGIRLWRRRRRAERPVAASDGRGAGQSTGRPSRG